MLWIPKGFAHGFLTLSDEAEIVYKVSGSEYSPEHDRCIRWNDPDINIKWPLDSEPILSEKDRSAPTLKEAEINFTYAG
jgi:dTDP-4-dehydrorhamnose 3,5-epimerase